MGNLVQDHKTIKNKPTFYKHGLSSTIILRATRDNLNSYASAKFVKMMLISAIERYIVIQSATIYFWIRETKIKSRHVHHAENEVVEEPKTTMLESARTS